MVPLSQTEEMAAVLTASGVPHDLLVFDDEQHRFCRTESRKCAHRAELAFHGTMFGL